MRTITYKEKKIKLIIPLYKAVVIQQLEYCIQAWKPYCKKDIDSLEKCNEEQLKFRDLSCKSLLETRRQRGDQIEVF